MGDGTRLDREGRRQRRQWWAAGAAAAFVVLRVALDDGPYAVLVSVVVVASAFALICLALGSRDLLANTNDEWAAHDAYRALSRADRRELEDSISARTPIRPDLLDVAELRTRLWVEQMRPVGWTAPGLALTPLSLSTTWILAFSVPVLVVATVSLWSRSRWTERYAAVLAQQRSATTGDGPSRGH